MASVCSRGRQNRLVQIGAVAVEAAVDAVAQILFHFGRHDIHGRHRRADKGEKILDLVALLEVGHKAAVAGDALGRIAALPQQHAQFPAGLEMGCGQLQMVALGGIGDAAAGKKRPPQKGSPAALLLQHSEVDMQDRVLPGDRIPTD